MMNLKISALGCALALACHTAPVGAVEAQTYPTKPITIVVPFAAGGATDASSRKIAELLTKRLGKPVIVDNRPGAGGLIGLTNVARAVPDGYTLGFAGNSPLTIAPYVSKKAPYDPQKAFVPVSLACVSSFTYTARPGLGVQTLPELIALARKQPGKITFASTGIGTSTQMLSELLKVAANIDLLHVPFKGESEGISALLGGQVDTMAMSSEGAMQYRQGNRLISLATTAQQRLIKAPDVPTVSEAGYARLQLELFFGLIAPAGTPSGIIERLSKEMKLVTADPTFIEIMQRTGYEAKSSSPAEFAAILKRHSEQWRSVIASNHISID